MTHGARRFHLERDVDVHNCSGVGVVAVGVRFPSGNVVIEWQTTPGSLGFFDNIDDLRTVHGHGRKTRIVWDDPAEGV